MRFFQNASYNFIGKRKTAYGLSIALCAVGILAMVFNVFSIGSWQNYGVDFTGGVLVQVRFENEIDVGDLRDAVDDQGAIITAFGGDSEFVVRMPLEEGVEVENIAARVGDRIAAAFGAESFDVVRTEAVGPQIGEELQTRAVMAMLLATLATLIYIGFRFELRFGLGAVISTAHDVIISLGILALFRVEFSLTTVAAILTIIGYSLNDTIVVYDRIRENLNSKTGRGQPLDLLLNRSINETLSRTIMTGPAVLGVLLALLIFGGDVIRDFSWTLIVGTIVGTYSSIFVAAPLLLEIGDRFGALKSERAGTKAGKKARASV